MSHHQEENSSFASDIRENNYVASDIRENNYVNHYSSVTSKSDSLTSWGALPLIHVARDGLEVRLRVRGVSCVTFGL